MRSVTIVNKHSMLTKKAIGLSNPVVQYALASYPFATNLILVFPEVAFLAGFIYELITTLSLKGSRIFRVYWSGLLIWLNRANWPSWM